jgi:hydroxymethylbilane synthase
VNHLPIFHLETMIMAETSPVQTPLRIGTRKSNLAVVQTEGIRDSLQKIAPDRAFEIQTLHTLGDKDKSTALYSFGAKNLWTAELEDLLTSGRLDVVVHCLKGESTLSSFVFRLSF